MTEAIQKRASNILAMPTSESKIFEVEKRVNSLAFHLAQRDIEFEEWRSKIENYLLNRTLTPIEASVYLKITRDAVCRSIKEGRLGGGRDGGRWKTTYRDVLDYMNKRPKKFGQNMTIMDIVKAE